MRLRYVGNSLVMVCLLLVLLGLGGAVFALGYLRGQDPWLTASYRADLLQQTQKQLSVEDISVYDLWNKTNQLRVENKQSVLVLDSMLNASALAKCQDMVAKDYLDHNDPTGRTPWHFMAEAGVKLPTLGENQAYGFRKAATLMNALRANKEQGEMLLSPKFSHVGMAVCKSQNFLHKGVKLIVVQHFAG